MAILSRNFKKIARHSIEAFFYAVLIFALSYFLTVFKDYCEETHRPQWFIFGVETLSIILFIADSIAVCMLAGLGLYHIIKGVLEK